MSFVDTLPQEIIRIIFKDCLSIAELFVCRGVCQSWKEAAEDTLRTTDKLWIAEGRPRGSPMAVCQDDPRHVITSKYRVQVFKRSRPFSDKEINGITRLCPSLRVVVLFTPEGSSKSKKTGIKTIIKKILMACENTLICCCLNLHSANILEKMSFPLLQHFYMSSGNAQEINQDAIKFLTSKNQHPLLRSMGFLNVSGVERVECDLPEGIERLVNLSGDGIDSLSSLTFSPAEQTIKTVQVDAQDIIDAADDGLSFPSVIEVTVTCVAYVIETFGGREDPERVADLISALNTVFPSLSRMICNVYIGYRDDCIPMYCFPLPILDQLDHIELDLNLINESLLNENLRLPRSVKLSKNSFEAQLMSRIVTGVQELHLKIVEDIDTAELITFVRTHLVGGNMRTLRIESRIISEFTEADMNCLRQFIRDDLLKSVKMSLNSMRINHYLFLSPTKWTEVIFEAMQVG